MPQIGLIDGWQVFDYECCACYWSGCGMTLREEGASEECSPVRCCHQLGSGSDGWIRRPILPLYRGDEWFSKGRFGPSVVVRLEYRGGGDERILGELGSRKGAISEVLVSGYTSCIYIDAFGRLETYQGRKIVSKPPGSRCLMTDCKQRWPRHY